MCWGHLAEGPAQKRLRDLPRHRREWLRLLVPLQAHPGEEISVSCLQGKSGKQPNHRMQLDSNLIRSVRMWDFLKVMIVMTKKWMLKRSTEDRFSPSHLRHHAICSALVDTLWRQLASWMLSPFFPLYASDLWAVGSQQKGALKPQKQII